MLFVQIYKIVQKLRELVTREKGSPILVSYEMPERRVGKNRHHAANQPRICGLGPRVKDLGRQANLRLLGGIG